MAGQVLRLEIDEETAAGLAELARSRQVPVAQLASDALDLFVTRGGQADAEHSWREADIAAIRRGVAQADRGELTHQSAVEREIDDLLR